jgi:WhiB family redox-sensing transcriptional regulator
MAARLPPVLQNWDWQRDAACRGMDSAMFFHPEGERDPARHRRVQAAAQVCNSCPVREPCRAWAHTTPELYGVWGGEGEDTRRRLLRHEHGSREVS